jgi:hypothetical protein
VQEARRRPVAGGLLVAVVVAALLVAWWWANDRPACRSGDATACTDTGPLVLLVGVPLALVLAWSALRFGGARSPLVALLVAGGAAYVVLLAGESLVEPPLGAWPFVVGAAVAAYLAVEDRILK